MTASANSQPIHLAITRRIKSGQEQEFQVALKEFFARSLAQSGVHGAAFIVPMSKYVTIRLRALQKPVL